MARRNPHDPREHFRTCYVPNYTKILAYVRRRSDTATSEDLTAEVFARAWRHWETHTGDDLPWLYGIARNVLLEHYRARDHQTNIIKASAQQVTDRTPDLTDAVDTSLSIHAALQRLNESDREILLLHAWEGLDPAEIAQVLDISANNARVKLHRARTHLDQILSSSTTASVTTLSPRRG